jgi:hypothetical protein
MARGILMLHFLKSRWQLLLITLLSLALVGVLTFFGILGQTDNTPSTDGRVRLLLTNSERYLVLSEMRNLLIATQVIVDAAVANDMTRVAVAARKVGMTDVHNIPAEVRGPLVGKLPLAFKRLGFDVHEGMDSIALDAESIGDRDHTLKQLSELMDKCIACHATYTVLPPS